MINKFILLVVALAAGWAVMRVRRNTLNPQPEPPGAAEPATPAGFTLNIGGAE